MSSWDAERDASDVPALLCCFTHSFTRCCEYKRLQMTESCSTVRGERFIYRLFALLLLLFFCVMRDYAPQICLLVVVFFFFFCYSRHEQEKLVPWKSIFCVSISAESRRGNKSHPRSNGIVGFTKFKWQTLLLSLFFFYKSVSNLVLTQTGNQHI